jgi:hypothetical protein
MGAESLGVGVGAAALERRCGKTIGKNGIGDTMNLATRCFFALGGSSGMPVDLVSGIIAELLERIIGQLRLDTRRFPNEVAVLSIFSDRL